MRSSTAGGDTPQENAGTTGQPILQQQQQPHNPPTTSTTTTPPSQNTTSDQNSQTPATELETETGSGNISISLQEESGASPPVFGPGGETAGGGDAEPEFPLNELSRLDELINCPRWVVPVLPKGELEVLLDAAIRLSKEGADTRSEACQRFFREGLTNSFTKILTDGAVSGGKYEIHKCVLKNAEKLVELCVYKLSQDFFPLLDLLAMVLNPTCKFHTYNATRPSETVQSSTQLAEDALFARPPDHRTPKGWLVDLVNRFGNFDGFKILQDRFFKGPALSVPVVASLIKPFGLCSEVLTPHTVEKYFMPIVELVLKFLDKLTDEELKKESKTEAKNDALSSIIKALKQLVNRLPNQEETAKNLEIFRLKMILTHRLPYRPRSPAIVHYRTARCRPGTQYH